MPTIVAQLSSLILPTAAEVDLPEQGTPQWSTEGVHCTLWDTGVPSFPQAATNPSRPVNPPALVETSPGHTRQLSGGIQDRFSSLPLPIWSPVYKHIADLTGKEEESNSSFTLTAEEVGKVGEREFLDFSLIFKRHLQSPYGLGNADTPSSGSGNSDMSVKDWARIFMVFQAENAP